MFPLTDSSVISFVLGHSLVQSNNENKKYITSVIQWHIFIKSSRLASLLCSIIKNNDWNE